MNGANPTETEVLQPTRWAFGPFSLDLQRKTLTEHGRPVSLGTRALTILTVLVGQAGEVVPHEVLLEKGWPGVTVIPENLRVQIAGLKRVLRNGDDRNAYIVNVPGQGYQFVGAVSLITEKPQPVRRTEGRRTIPDALGRLIGRDEVVHSLAAGLQVHRLTTIVGPGGIGKTTIALAVARLSASPRVWFVDLSKVVAPADIPAAIATAPGIDLTPRPSVEVLVDFFYEAPGLLVLDNCEHLVEGCATLVEHLLGRAPDLVILATSRNPLRAAGEAIHKLQSLALPPPTVQTLAEVERFASVQLLLERATLAGLTAALTDLDAGVLADLCRRLDGVPLAIELAAATIGQIGFRRTATLLRESLNIASPGRSTAHPRQRTLWATFAWSYGLLTPIQQGVLRRIAVFKAPIPFDPIATLCGDLGLSDHALMSALIQLVDQSLINVDISGDQATYTLLQTTREFAQEHTPPEEAERTTVGHARLQVAFLKEAASGWRFSGPADWLASFAPRFDDVSVAYAWSLSSGGDVAIAVQLLRAAQPYLFYLSRLHVAFDWSQAFERRFPEDALSPQHKLEALHGQVFAYIFYQAPHLAQPAGVKLLEVARALDQFDAELVARWGLCLCAGFTDDYANAKGHAESFLAVATRYGQAPDIRFGWYLLAFARLAGSDVNGAREAIETAFGIEADPEDGLGVIGCQFDPAVQEGGLRAKILWLQGYAQDAIAEVRRVVEKAREGEHASSISRSAAMSAAALTVAGDLEGAYAALETFDGILRNIGPRGMKSNGVGLRVAADLEKGAWVAPERLSALLVRSPTNTFPYHYPELTGQLAIALAKAGELAVPQAFLQNRLKHGPDAPHWSCPEHLRARAALKRMIAADDPEVVVDLETGLDLARRSGAFVWELRIVHDLGEILRTQGRVDEARALIEATLARARDRQSSPELDDLKALDRLWRAADA